LGSCDIKIFHYLNKVKNLPLTTSRIRQSSYLYLLAVPPLATALAFIVGHVHYTIYLPLWVLNAVLMVLATRKLAEHQEQSMSKTAWLFVIPWILIAIFGGMGPPPETAASWAALAGEQVIRYTILIISGTLTGVGFIRLHRMLANQTGYKFSGAGVIMICIALPLFVLNMAYWGYFLTHIFVAYSLPDAPAKPAWLKQLSDLFTLIRMIEVCLIYLSTAAFALALRYDDRLSKTSSSLYVLFACLAAVFNLLPPSVTGLLAIANYLSYIPAFTLLMPYLIAVNLLWKGK
jgi:hypothetical protein